MAALNIPTVTVVGYVINKSVGRGGVNLGWDNATIKNMLNKIAPENGGAGETLDEENTSNSGPDFENLVNQIIIFQSINFPAEVNGKKNPFYFAPDGLVSPERSTIKRMRELVNPRSGGLLTPSISVKPNASIVGKSDLHGFSAEMLRKGADKLWSERDPLGFVTQFVPVSENRTLIITLPYKNMDWAPTGYDDTIVNAVKLEDKLILTGLRAGITKLSLVVDNGVKETTLQIVVRKLQTLSLKMVQLGPPPLGLGSALDIQSSVIFGLNSILKNQTNISITAGPIETMRTIKARGKDITFDPMRTIFETADLAWANPAADLITKKDLLDTLTGDNTLTIFCHGLIMDPSAPRAMGSALGYNSRAAWIRTSGGSLYTLFIAHELGHALGLRHIKAPNSDFFLMNETMRVKLFDGTSALNRQIIPSETLVDLGL
jgi:hypothetical protein